MMVAVVFTVTDIGSETDKTFSIALGDMDGDGHLDLVIGNYYQANRTIPA